MTHFKDSLEVYLKTERSSSTIFKTCLIHGTWIKICTIHVYEELDKFNSYSVFQQLFWQL